MNEKGKKEEKLMAVNVMRMPFYDYFKLTNGGYGFEVMSRNDIDFYAKECSKPFDSAFAHGKIVI